MSISTRALAAEVFDTMKPGQLEKIRDLDVRHHRAADPLRSPQRDIRRRHGGDPRTAHGVNAVAPQGIEPTGKPSR
ncbi:MAG TPA: hypothetical protein VF926_14500 [Mycobacterium sp.]